ncbi:hypothetical protein [Halosegnis longus]|uniref:hypothetical protein n=1 Tax=Halosegnis longus TaxID=2216012 RepID=UPI00129D7514|nr:hypothetical protein [Halosegnis longus]
MSEAVEFGDKSDADRFREERPAYICPIDDDKRTRTVHFTSDTPADVLEQARTVAEAGFADREAREAKPGNRELTESEKRGLDFSRDGVSYVKAKALANVAEEYGVNAFEHVDVAEVDTADDARPIFERARRSGGTGRGGGTAQYDDEAAEREDREQRKRGERQEQAGCDHARDFCQSGDSEACEYLQERCGLSEDEATSLLAEREPAGEEAADASESEPWIPGEKWADLSGSERGAVSRAAGGYHGATDTMRRSLAEFTAAFKQAQAAAKAINGLRAGVDEGPLHFSELEDANAALLDAARMAAEHCHECHADHADHDHDVTEGGTEDLRRFVRAGGEATPVGLQDGIGPARSPAEHPDAVVADREPKPGDTSHPDQSAERTSAGYIPEEADEVLHSHD